MNFGAVEWVAIPFMHRSIGGRISLFGAIRHGCRPSGTTGPMELSQRQPVSCVPLVSSGRTIVRAGDIAIAGWMPGPGRIDPRRGERKRLVFPVRIFAEVAAMAVPDGDGLLATAKTGIGTYGRRRRRSRPTRRQGATAGSGAVRPADQPRLPSGARTSDAMVAAPCSASSAVLRPKPHAAATP